MSEVLMNMAQRYAEVRARLQGPRTPPPEQPSHRRPYNPTIIEKIHRRASVKRDYLYVASGTVETLPHATSRDKNLVANIVDVCAEQFNVPHQIIFSKSRQHSVVHCRHRIWSILHYQHGWNLSKIGKAFGKDHTTIRHGILRHGDRLQGRGAA